MRTVYLYTVPALWAALGLYWIVVGSNVKTTARRERAASRAAHLVPLAAAFLLLALPGLPGGVLAGRFVPWRPANFWLGAVMVAAGLGFALWARQHLGRNWSMAVTVKDGHELVRTGPYGWVRHPIYTGLLLAFVGSALALGQWRGLLAVAIAAAALWRKLRLEERWMVQTFGERYRTYQAEVAALIPYVL